MDKKTLIPLVAALAVILLSIGAYALFGGSRGAQGGLPKNPPVVGLLKASTGDSVTITLGDNSERTFAVSADTRIVSRVASGEVGKALAEIAPGTPVMIQPHAPNAAEADSVNILSMPSAQGASPGGPMTAVVGTIVSTSTGSIIIKTDTDSQARIIITTDTVFLSDVLAGQKGRTLSDAALGTYVQVLGTAGAQGLAARTVQILMPLSR